MDLLYFVDERLKFIRDCCPSTVAAFQETMRKIEAEEPPYVDTRNPEYAEEAAFLEEWENADAAVNIAGATCLELLQSTFHSYLHEYMREIGQAHLRAHLREMKGKELVWELQGTLFESAGDRLERQRGGHRSAGAGHPYPQRFHSQSRFH